MAPVPVDIAVAAGFAQAASKATAAKAPSILMFISILSLWGFVLTKTEASQKN